MISVCFRFDDPSSISDHGLEEGIIDVFARLDVPLCVAPIPFARAVGGGVVRLAPQNASHLIDAARAGIIEIAQHGHSHARRGVDARGVRSEFAGVAAAEQARLIAEGRKHLSSIFSHRIRGFVPPWNTYDLATAQALEEAGFEFLSAGWEMLNFGRLAVVPRTCTLREARSAMEGALCFQSLAPVIVVVFHPDDFEEFKFPPLADEPPPFTSLGELEALLGWMKTIPAIRTSALSRIAEDVRNGMPLRNPRELKLPYRVKALIPPVLVRSADWRILPAILWGAFRSKYGSRG